MGPKLATSGTSLDKSQEANAVCHLHAFSDLRYDSDIEKGKAWRSEGMKETEAKI